MLAWSKGIRYIWMVQAQSILNMQDMYNLSHMNLRSWIFGFVGNFQEKTLPYPVSCPLQKCHLENNMKKKVPSVYHKWPHLPKVSLLLAHHHHLNILVCMFGSLAPSEPRQSGLVLLSVDCFCFSEI